MDEFRLRDGEANAQPGPSGLQHRELPLQVLDVTPIRGRGNRQAEVVDVGEGETLGDLAVESGHINDKQKRGDGEPGGVPTATGANSLGERS